MSEGPPPVAIRVAERIDLDACLELLVQLNDIGTAADPRFRLKKHSRALLRAHLLDAWFGRFLPFPACLLAERGGVVVGLVSGEPLQVHAVLDQPPTARMDNLWVAAEHRRTGVARALVTRFCDAARAAGYPRLEVTTLARDDRALAFWRAVGFDDLRVTLSS